MKKTIALAFLFMSFISTQEALAQVNIGYTNPSKILSQLPEVAEIDKKIDTLISQKDQELAEKATALQQQFSNYETNMGTLSQQERSEQEQALMELNEKFEADRTQMLEEVRQKRNELMEPILMRMSAAMEEIAEEMELDLILNEGTSSGDAIIFFANDEKLDISSKIVEKLNN